MAESWRTEKKRPKIKVLPWPAIPAPTVPTVPSGPPTATGSPDGSDTAAAMAAERPPALAVPGQIGGSAEGGSPTSRTIASTHVTVRTSQSIE